jgi:hypothetical protein
VERIEKSNVLTLLHPGGTLIVYTLTDLFQNPHTPINTTLWVASVTVNLKPGLTADRIDGF